MRRYSQTWPNAGHRGSAPQMVPVVSFSLYRLRPFWFCALFLQAALNCSLPSPLAGKPGHPPLRQTGLPSWTAVQCPCMSPCSNLWQPQVDLCQMLTFNHSTSGEEEYACRQECAWVSQIQDQEAKAYSCALCYGEQITHVLVKTRCFRSKTVIAPYQTVAYKEHRLVFI